MQESYKTSEDFDNDPEYRLVDACCDGDTEIVRQITNLKTLPPASLENGLYCALYKRQIEVARSLLEHNIQITSAAVLGAVQSEYLECFQLLIEYGWNVNAPLSDGGTVLIAMIDHEAILDFLLSHGANPNLGPRLWNDNTGSSSIDTSGAALNAAAAYTSFAVLQKLLKNGAKLENSMPLHHAAAVAADAERLPMMAELLKLGIDVNADDKMMGPYSRGPPIVRAIEAGCLKKVQFLLEHGAVVDERTLLVAERIASPVKPEIMYMLRQARTCQLKPMS